MERLPELCLLEERISEAGRCRDRSHDLDSKGLEDHSEHRRRRCAIVVASGRLIDGSEIQRSPMTHFGCDLNWSTQHFSLFEKTGVNADEAAPPHLLFSRATGRDLGAMAPRGDDARHRPLVRSRPFLDLLGSGAERGHSTAAAATIAAGFDPCRARGDFAWPGRWPIASLDGASAGTFTLDAQPRDRAQWRIPALPRGRRRQARLAIRLCAQSHASWRCMLVCGKLLRQSWHWNGRPSRSRAG